MREKRNEGRRKKREKNLVTFRNNKHQSSSLSVSSLSLCDPVYVWRSFARSFARTESSTPPPTHSFAFFIRVYSAQPTLFYYRVSLLFFYQFVYFVKLNLFLNWDEKGADYWMRSVWTSNGHRGTTARRQSGCRRKERPLFAQQCPPPLALCHPRPARVGSQKVFWQILCRIYRSHQ